MNPGSRIPQLVEALRGEIAAAASGGRLPALRRLCRKYDVSMPTLRKAAGQLRAGGELAFRRGQAPRVPGTEPALPSSRPDALALILSHVRARIGEGDWPVGQPLPKVADLTRQFGASDHTVSRAMGQLERERLIHRRGRGRIVGPAIVGEAAVQAATQPRFILVVQNSWSTWQGICDADRTERFASAFWGEAERLGIELLPVVGREDDPYAQAYHAYIAGERSVLDYVRARRGRYLGALLCSSAQDPAGGGVLRWVKALLPFGKPMVFLDHEAHGVLGDFRHPLLTQCRPSDAAVVPCAVETLAAYGHRCVGYPVDDRVPWEVERLDYLERAAATLAPPMRVVRQSRLETAPLGRALRERLHARLRQVSELSPSRLSAVLDDVMRNQSWAAWVGRLLAEPEITAIVAPHDAVGRNVYEWLSALRVSLPERFSLLSFDNYRGTKALPMTSVDFGFSRLGYCAFHAILRTIPIAADRTGTIWAKPFVAHRASLGKEYRACG